ncbi:hypothetical protein [Microbulbifer sp. YPW16]|uniref:hypothetical protein n=1 Tax=unclassified Microbulbifer TaxID=2619833 RepID=UPI001E3CD40C|nr:hypothetical protein [Microbulbifer sp. YPW16]UHQ54129.1 hypothetical protein LVE68_11430 [Microbulbifer sp. YPW16]
MFLNRIKLLRKHHYVLYLSTLAFLLALLFTISVAYLKRFNLHSHPERVAAADDINSSSEITPSPGNKNTGERRSPSFQILGSQELSSLEADSQKWKRKRGYFSEEELGLYLSYDRDTLWKLANQGDLIAMDLWADTLDREGYEEEAIQARLISAAYGPTEPLTEMVSIFRTNLWSGDLEEVDRLVNLKSMLVYAEVAAMRGDPEGILVSLHELHRSGVSLSESEKMNISSSAKEIYDSLTKQREAIGLPPFDNHTHPFVELQFSFMAYPIPNPNQWASDYINEAPRMVITNPGE